MTEEQEPPSAPSLAISAIVFYALMSLLGIALLDSSTVSTRQLVFGDGQSLVGDTLLGAGSGILVVGLTWLVRNQRAVKRLNADFRTMLGTPPTGVIAVLALTSAIGEELLFRGALQEILGFVPTVLLFGFVHGGLSRKYRAWAFFATLAGVLLGWLALATGNLLAPILCHMTVNYFNLHLVCAQSEVKEPN